MKKLLLLATCIALVSCDSSDDEETTITTSLATTNRNSFIQYWDGKIIEGSTVKATIVDSDEALLSLSDGTKTYEDHYQFQENGLIDAYTTSYAETYYTYIDSGIKTVTSFVLEDTTSSDYFDSLDTELFSNFNISTTTCSHSEIEFKLDNTTKAYVINFTNDSYLDVYEADLATYNSAHITIDGEEVLKLNYVRENFNLIIDNASKDEIIILLKAYLK